ncbi:aspartate aminotransferase family protein [Paraburkholderia silviterrae]|uniref:Aminotransferase class III-fold pyridoxal phosphate-dependent enzyme n=1 Tax=Paraburkholderia silviterrae TaxID=2528715 RepID=A0A4R5M153_9BURK|nr:aminotransferase class III-fold pyridoxal phosphate-dependent enzyme [Paraburkholderia silviterrae]TDG18992.1 aminotransferase class III-fold pyridoxal phosphate-dependent enzyme [Paraburkholderia silviterrae]
MASNDPIAVGIIERYRSGAPHSAAAFATAAASLPGGDTRTMTSYRPFPLYFERGAGTRLKDVDGVWREDFLTNYGALAHGHDHPALIAAVREQVALGTLPGGPTRLQYEHAELLKALVPSMERVRYCNSGTEATMWAIRTARAYTGRDIVLKIDGGYHGTHDWTNVNAFITNGQTYDQAVGGLPAGYLAHGVPPSVLETVVAIPYNDADTATRVMNELRGKVAGVIVEPVLGVGGAVPADRAYLATLRKLCTDHGAVLMFDECASIRVGPWQVKHGVTPDLSTFSKIVGGGLPIGVFGGRADIMKIFDPFGPDPVYHAGAYCANNLSLAAGIAAMKHLDASDFKHLTALGERLRTGLTAAAASVGVVGRAIGEGGMTYFHFTREAPRNAADTARVRKGRDELRSLVHLQMLNEGFVTARHGLLCQHVMTETTTVDAFVDAYGSTLAMLVPYISRNHPELLVPVSAHA